jgi:hypothetical protein
MILFLNTNKIYGGAPLKTKKETWFRVAAIIILFTLVLTFMAGVICFFQRDLRTMDVVIVSNHEVKIEHGLFIPAAVVGEDILKANGYDDFTIHRACKTHLLVLGDITKEYREKINDGVAYPTFGDFDVSTNIYTNEEEKTFKLFKEIFEP